VDSVTGGNVDFFGRSIHGATLAPSAFTNSDIETTMMARIAEEYESFIFENEIQPTSKMIQSVE